jgi:hypothetical protein
MNQPLGADVLSDSDPESPAVPTPGPVHVSILLHLTSNGGEGDWAEGA